MTISKDDYILRTFSKIRHKKWELYVVTRIIHLLNDPEIEFVCQQLIRTNERRRYLADLCFPGLRLYCEIDELQHATKEHQIRDEHRMREIINAVDFNEHRIQVYGDDNEYKDLEEINKDICKFVAFVKKRKQDFISNNDFIPWDYEKKFDPKPHIEKGYIDIKDNIVFLNHRDALRCFGYKKRGHYQRAVWRIPDQNNRMVWFPKLYKNEQWDNYLSDDFEKIIVKRNDENKVPTDLSKSNTEKMIVFAHNKNQLGQVLYKFLGEFYSCAKKSNEYMSVYIRKQTKIELAGFQ